MSGLDFELPAVVPAGLITWATARDVPFEDLLSATGLDPEMLADPERPVPARVMIPLWKLLLDRFPGEPVPLQLAETMSFEFLGLAGQVIRHSRTVRDAVTRTLRFQRLYDPGLFTTFDVSEGRVTYGIGHVEEVRALGAPLEFMAAVTVHYIRQMIGERVPAIEVSLETQPRCDREAYARYFGGAVRFGQPRTLVVIDAGLLDRPVVGADDSVLRYLSAYADQQLRQAPEIDPSLGLAERVRRALERGLLEGDAEPSVVARILAMSERTLQRRLAAEGTTFQSLQDQVRRETAMRLLARDETPIQEVAFTLGYQDAPSFYRAFKRWTGRTPAEVRRELRA